MSTLLFIIIFQASTIIILLSLNRHSRTENIFLIQLLFAIFLHACFKISLLFLYGNEAYFEKIHGSFSLLYGPLLYFFATKKPTNKLNISSFAFHLLPFFGGLLLNIYLLFSIELNQNIDATLDVSDKILGLFVMLSLCGYSILSLSSIKKSEILQHDLYKLKLVKAYAYAFIGFIVFDLFILFVLRLDGIGQFVRYVFYVLMLTLFFIALFYYAKNENRIDKRLNEEEEPSPNIEKYRNSALGEEYMSQIIHQIESIFNKEEPFLEHDFCLDDLSQMTGLAKNHITQALNLQLKKNFYQLINEKRILKSIDLIVNDRYSNQMQIIAAKSGFKSKTTFYKYFKEFTGTSPLEYRKALHNC
jgi:AraC-like DNA-binding protein